MKENNVRRYLLKTENVDVKYIYGQTAFIASILIKFNVLSDHKKKLHQQT